MYYEFYIDQFAAEHFLTGCLLLSVTSRFLGRRIPWMRIVIGSIVNSVIMILCILLGIPGGYAVGILAAGFVVFYEKSAAVGKLIKGMGAILAVTVCFGGVLEILMDLLGLPAFAGMTASVLILYAAVIRWQKQGIFLRSVMTVQLYWNGQSRTVRALLDTGNQLREPLTGMAVSILQADAAQQLLGEAWEQRRGFYLIPYHSLGTEKSWMRGVKIDRMCIEYSGKRTDVETPVLAIYEGQVSNTGRYQMILHPEHAGETKHSCTNARG